MQSVNSILEFDTILKENLGVLAYFSHEKCSVCKTLKPKLSAYFSEHFTQIKQIYIDIEKLPELAARSSIFTVPVILVYFEGKETYRKARVFGIEELAELVARPYSLLF
jgi:thiol-disulfide isomerase/thioredoxin